MSPRSLERSLALPEEWCPNADDADADEVARPAAVVPPRGTRPLPAAIAPWLELGAGDGDRPSSIAWFDAPSVAGVRELVVAAEKGA